MGFSVGFVAGFVGVLALCHAAYSTFQYKGLLKNTQDDFSGPLFNVVVGLILCTWAAITVPDIFLSIHPHSDDNRVIGREIKMWNGILFVVALSSCNRFAHKRTSEWQL